jgi:hypothetical protein
MKIEGASNCRTKWPMPARVAAAAKKDGGWQRDQGSRAFDIEHLLRSSSIRRRYRRFTASLTPRIITTLANPPWGAYPGRERRPGGGPFKPPGLVVEALKRGEFLRVPELRLPDSRLHDRDRAVIHKGRHREGMPVLPAMCERERAGSDFVRIILAWKMSAQWPDWACLVNHADLMRTHGSESTTRVRWRGLQRPTSEELFVRQLVVEWDRDPTRRSPCAALCSPLPLCSVYYR